MPPSLLLTRSLIKYVCEMAFPAVLTIMHGSHEDTGSALSLS